jgi:hypothetical protein
VYIRGLCSCLVLTEDRPGVTHPALHEQTDTLGRDDPEPSGDAVTPPAVLPAPTTCGSRLPCSATFSPMSAVSFFSRASMSRISPTSSRATSLRVISAVPTGDRSNPGQDPGRVGRGQVSVRAAGHQIAQQGVQLVDQPGALRDQVGSALVQQRQRGADILPDDWSGIPAQSGDTGGRGRVDHVVLAAPAPGQFAYAGGRRARHVVHLFTACDQPLREVAAEPAGVLHRPPAAGEPSGPPLQLSIPGQGCLDLQRGHDPVRIRVQGACGVGPLVRIDTDDDHNDLQPSATGSRDHGRHPDFQHRRGGTPLSSQTAARDTNWYDKPRQSQP